MKQLTGEHDNGCIAPLINMNDTWLTTEQFTEDLNSYYLESYSSAEISFPDIPTMTRFPEVDEMRVYKLLSDINTRKATNN